MLKSLFNDSVSSINLESLLICSLVSIIIGLIIAFVHMKTSRYSKNFLITLASLPLLVQSVIIMVNGNLGTSVAIVGAFSLVRFRSIPGTSKEILSVFFAMAVGLATGMGHIFFALLVTILGCLLILVLTKVNLFDDKKGEKMLKIVIPENLDYESVFKEEFNKYTQKVTLEEVKTTNMGSLFELKYRLVLNKNIKEKEFIDDLRIKNGNLKIMLSHPIDGADL